MIRLLVWWRACDPRYCVIHLLKKLAISSSIPIADGIRADHEGTLTLCKQIFPHSVPLSTLFPFSAPISLSLCPGGVVGQLIENGKSQAWLIDIVEQYVLPGGSILLYTAAPIHSDLEGP